jgi:hypothetical protein
MLEKKGLVKLVEECGELQQIAAKKMARMDSDDHWDNAGPISERLENEIADVKAAMWIVEHNFNLSHFRIDARAHEKFSLFVKWMEEND